MQLTQANGLDEPPRDQLPHVLDVLRTGIDSALLALGRSSVHELTSADLVIPDYFARALGT